MAEFQAADRRSLICSFGSFIGNSDEWLRSWFTDALGAIANDFASLLSHTQLDRFPTHWQGGIFAW